MFGMFSSRLSAALTTIVVSAMALALLAASGVIAQAGAAGNVTTAGYNTLRDSWDPNEPALSPSAVQSGSFGQLFSTKVKGSVYAQPLIYNGDVIVTTEEANAYAINASTGAIVWEHSFGTPFKAKTIECSDLKPYLGSTSTPVIDPNTGIIYMTTRLQEGGNGLAEAHWTLQAISAATGEDQPGYPVRITGTPSNTPGVPFNESYQQQRPGLLLLNGVVYIAFASDCDLTPYRGIVVGVSTAKHEITTMWSDESGVGTDENSQAGIWQSGGGLVSDIPDRIILATGNGISPQPAPSSAPPATLSESVVGLTVEANGQLKPSQFFAPSDAPFLDEEDGDLGSGGPVALPTEYFGTKSIPHLVVQTGKDGRIFLINADDMGGFRQGPGEADDVLQTLGPFTGVWGHPAVYGGQGGWVYVLENAGGGNLLALSYGLTGEGSPALTLQGTSAESFGYTSGSPLVTSNGSSEGSAVVWVVYTNSELGGKAQLRAYSATPAGGSLPLLWSGKIGKASKFATPTAYEGRVYVGTRNGRLIAFGPSANAPVQAAPVSLGSVPVGQSATTMLSIAVNQDLKFTAPLTAFGERSVTALEPNVHTGAPQLATSPKTAGSKLAFPKTAGPTTAGRKTAGPRIPPPSGQTATAPGVLTLQQPRIDEAIQAGSTERLRVRFAPDHAGPVVGVVSIPTSAGTETVPVSGYGTKPGLLLSVKPLAFGTVSTNTVGKALTLTFSNSWDRPETITGFRLPGAPYRVSGLPTVGTVLAPRQAITVSVRFHPSRAGSYRSSFGISTDHGSLSLPATGVAVEGHPRLAVSTTSIDVGAVPVGQSKRVTFQVSDTGTVALTISRSIGPIGAFAATVPLPEGITIQSGLSVAVSVTFRPTAVGPASGTYLLDGNDGRGYVRVRFEGVGVRRR